MVKHLDVFRSSNASHAASGAACPLELVALDIVLITLYTSVCVWNAPTHCLDAMALQHTTVGLAGTDSRGRHGAPSLARRVPKHEF